MKPTDEMIKAAQAELAGKSSWTLSRETVERVLTAALSLAPQVKDTPPPPSTHVAPEYERQEAICTDAAMSQWERSLKRPDMQEKDRVRGAVEAYKRQALAFRMLPPAPEKHVEAAQPVAYRWRWTDSEAWVLTREKPDHVARVVEPLFTAPAPEKHVVGDLDYCFDPENWEFTCSWPERDQVHGYGESLKPGQPMRVCTLLKGPDKWVADVPITWDEDGEPDETEIRWFDSEEEARAALATTEGKDNG